MNPRMLSPALCALLVTTPLFLAAAPAAAVTPGSWGTAGPIETDNAGEAFGPQVAVDASGNAVAVWYQFDGTRYNVWANRYVAGMGWGTAALIETDNAGTAQLPQVAVDGSGNAVAVWFQFDGTRYNVWANRYVAGTGWGTAALIETDNAAGAGYPQVAFDGSGNAVAVWSQSDGTRSNVWANRYVAGTGWGTAELIETNNSGPVSFPQVAVDVNGNAVAVWYQFDGIRNNIWANRYAVGTGWGTAVIIEWDGGETRDPQVAVDAGGNAVAVWYQSDGTRLNIWANRYVAGTGWGTAGLIEMDNAGGAAGPQVALDGSGNAVAVWYQSDGTRNNIWANRYVAGTGWGTAGLIETDNSGEALYPQVAFDGSGNAVAVWTQYDGTRNNIGANRYAAGTGWGTAGLIETDNAGYAYYPQVAVDGSGNAVAVWYQFDGTRYTIWANRGVEDYAPALSLSSPVEGTSTNRSTVWVGGLTEPGATVSVNGVAATVASDGSFGFPLALSPGLTLVSATAWDRAGNGASTSANVTFNDPLPALEQDLADAQAGLSAAQADLATTRAQLDLARADLAREQERVRALEANASATQAELEAAQANLTAAQARVSTLEANASATQAELEAAQADLTGARADLTAAQARVTAVEASATATAANLAAARDDLAAAQARVTTLETKTVATDVEVAKAGTQAAAASAQAGTAMMIGAAGIVLGGLSAVLALRKKGEADP